MVCAMLPCLFTFALFSLCKACHWRGRRPTMAQLAQGQTGTTERTEWPLHKKVDKQSNNIIQKTQHIKHDTEMHLTSAMNAWPSEQRCMGWTQWAAHEDRHLVPSLELTQEETGFVKNRLLQLTNICYKHPWKPWSVHPSLQLPGPTTHFTIASEPMPIRFLDEKKRFPTLLQHFAWHFAWPLACCVWVVNHDPFLFVSHLDACCFATVLHMFYMCALLIFIVLSIFALYKL